jgi:5-methylthioadenosine/S-adenosylhomocysteine deaminase
VAEGAEALVIRGGRVLTMDAEGTELPVGDVLVRGDRIAAVGAGLPVEPGTPVLDAAGGVVLPGLVDTHRHLWLGALSGLVDGGTLGTYASRVNTGIGARFHPEDIRAGVLSGALQALDAGITTVADWGHNMLSAEHADADLAALAESGLRTVLYYAGPGTDPTPRGLRAEARRLAGGLPERVTLGLGLRGAAFASPDEAAAEFAVARSLGLPISVHVGMAGFEGTVAALADRGLLGPDVNHVHANALSRSEFDLIASSGGSVAMSPTSELMLGLGATTAWLPVRERGIRAGLAVDTVAAAGTDLFSEMRLALATERARATASGSNAGLRAADALRLATADGASALPLPVATGVLAPGRAADVIVVDARAPHLSTAGDPAQAVVLGAGAADVGTVIVGGVVRKRDGRLVGAAAEGIDELVAASRARLRPRDT